MFQQRLYIVRNKPWVTRDIKVILNEKKRALRDRHGEEVKQVQRKLKVKIKQGKDSYRRKLEQKLEQNNGKDVWSGINVSMATSRLVAR